MTVLVPMTIEQDEDGWWCAHAQLGPNVGANGQGRTRKEALDDLREAVLASVPVHRNQDVRIGTLRAILRDCRLTADEFLNMLD